MPTNDWQVGLQYDKKWNNVAWTQPGGVGTKVYPQQVTGNSDLLTNEPFSELSGTFLFGCGHSVNQVLLQIDWNYDTDEQVALICCPTCSFVQRVISPATLAYNTLLNAVLTP